jgi:hypothetical protein
LSPDRRQHRGAHPADSKLFSTSQLPALRTAVAELSWLLTRGYQPLSALKLVGDRHRLTARQRLGVMRASCSDASLEQRAGTSVTLARASAQALLVDGFNLLITIEAALSGGPLFICRDKCVRDLASVHGSYRSVAETEQALLLIGQALEGLMPASVVWLLDRPISNSGRLATLIRNLAAAHGWPWQAELPFNPDREILSADAVIITSDSLLLDQVPRWLNLAWHLVTQQLAGCWVLDLSRD